MTAETTVVTRWADRRATPWKNGGGVTRELAASPPGSDAGEFDWRVSIADVAQPGPFSTFLGVDRAITLLEGSAMVLHLTEGDTVLEPREPFRFRGDDEVTCSLPHGPTRDLNVMTRRGRARAQVEVHGVSGTARLGGDGKHHLVVALDDGVPARSSSGVTWTLERYDVLEASETSSETARVGPGAFVVIRIA